MDIDQEFTVRLGDVVGRDVATGLSGTVELGKVKVTFNQENKNYPPKGPQTVSGEPSHFC